MSKRKSYTAQEMRERCEEVIADVNRHNSRFDHGIATPEFDANEIVDYILGGATIVLQSAE